MNKNIFLDAGGVILDETSFEEYSAKIISAVIAAYNKNYSEADYWKNAEEAVYRYVPKVYDYILYKNINTLTEFGKAKSQYKTALNAMEDRFCLMDGIEDFLKIFSRNYKIGIVGQYGKSFKEYLEKENVLQYFSYTETQDNYSITKPDPRYFEAILKKCGCKPEESVMIGDRIDKDIIPAKMIGMKTVRLRTGIHKNQEPRIPEEIPDLTVTNLRDIGVESIESLR